MKKANYYLVYLLIVTVFLIPVVPMPIKGILGFIVILWSSIKLGLKAALFTATLCILLCFLNRIVFKTDRQPQTIIVTIAGAAAYYLIAYYSGRYSETLSMKNEELRNEIGKRQRVEEELNDRLGQLKILMDTIPSPIFFKGLNGRYLGCNRAFMDSLGIKETELVGKIPDEVFDPPAAKLCNESDGDLLAGALRHTYEETIKCADGSNRNVLVNKGLFLDKNRNPAGIVGVMTDITDQKEAAKLKQSIVESKHMMDEMLEHDKLKTEFFSNISHEFRTPLNVILGSLQLMELYLTAHQYAVSREKVISRVAVLKQNSYRLLRLVNNLIDISRIDAKAFEMHFRNCDIVGLIRDITLSVSNYTESEGIRVTFETDVESRIMACDDEKVGRILLNLLSNAIKFTPKSGKISVRISNQADGVCIHVEDNGIGIPADKQGQIFQRFCRIDRIFTRQHEGSGIGLSLVKSLVEMHGGTITFASKVGKGTSFLIYLPHNDIDEDVLRYKIIEEQAYTDKITLEFSDIYSIGKK